MCEDIHPKQIRLYKPTTGKHGIGRPFERGDQT